MPKNTLVINCDIRETRVALIEGGVIAELQIERANARGTVGNIVLGRVTRVLPGMQAAFIDVGMERAAFLHVEDLIRPDDFEAYLSGDYGEIDKSDSGKDAGRGSRESDEDDLDSSAYSAIDPEGEGSDDDDDEDDLDDDDRDSDPGDDDDDDDDSAELLSVADTFSESEYDDDEDEDEDEDDLDDDEDDLDDEEDLDSDPGEGVGEEANAAVAASGAEARRSGRVRGRRKVADETLGEDEPVSSEPDDDEDIASGVEQIPLEEEEEEGRGAGRRRRRRRRTGPAASDNGGRNGARRHSGSQKTGSRPNARGRDRRPGRSSARVSRSVPITDVVKEGDQVIVQISKEPIGTKGARVTSHVSLPGRYCVFLPTVDHIGISKRIGSGGERARLRK